MCLFTKNKLEYCSVLGMAESICSETLYIPIADNIVYVLESYAKKKNIKMSIMYIPLQNNQLWGMFFIKQDVYFIIVNSNIDSYKNNITLAHELYHLMHSVTSGIAPENESFVENGDSVRFELEESKANAFAATLMIPSNILYKIFVLCDSSISEVIKKSKEVFQVPYKTIVIRLYETGIIKKNKCEELLNDRIYCNDIYNNVNDSKIDEVFAVEELIKLVDLGDLKELFEKNTNMDLMSDQKLGKQIESISEIIKSLKEGGK